MQSFTTFLVAAMATFPMVLGAPAPVDDVPSTGNTTDISDGAPGVMLPWWSARCNSQDIFKAADTYWLRANCQKKNNRGYQCSSLDLNKCYADNGNGYLIEHDGGQFADNCNFCQIIKGKTGVNSMMSCFCNGAKHATFVDLDDLVGNDDGRLICYGSWAGDC